MSKYSVLIQYDERDNIYVASIPELQGCMAHGSSQEEAVKEINIALDLWLETIREENRQIPNPMLYVS
ncbi:MAG: type II toxin-antitoxin system HicB family antitoxin [Clostridiales bacterium]|jgi:predicted RNase H-like HicB family nuclease|nr:type II toxin-antitoxin system HicB family antitoxin [Clostridiales bacterium]